MKLLYIHNSYLDSQSANTLQVLYMCNAFEELGCQIQLALPFHRKKQKNQNIIIKEKLGKYPNFHIINFKRHDIFGRMKWISGYSGIKTIIKNCKYDIIYTRLPISLIIAMAMGKKTIYESHNFIMHNNSPLLSKYFQNQLIKLSNSKNFLKIVVISNNLKKKWIDAGINSKKLLVLHDAICEDEFIENRDMLLERKKLNLPLDRKLVVYVGSLYKNRGIENIIELAKLNKDPYFVVVGGPELQRIKYEKMAKNENIKNILFAGYVSHQKVLSYLFSSDVLLMIWTNKINTINYCSPLKVFEYMAAGRVIVGHKFPTISEVLTNNENAFLVPTGSVNELNVALQKALQLEYPNAMVEKARKLVFENYTWKIRAKKIIEEINNFERYSY
ncbi:glycosyltransferase [bacterium]|nr:MAG: glycosyltransferase [bacterium]